MTNKKSLDQGEMYVMVTYDMPNECSAYMEIKSGFRTSFWVTEGAAAAVMFVDIPGDVLLPGETKKILAYFLDTEFSRNLIASGKAHWGGIVCSLGTLYNVQAIE